MARIYQLPTHDIPAQELKAQAARRRMALVAGGCSTYNLGTRDGRSAIVCLCCGLGSLQSRDVRERYCRFCQTYHNDWADEAWRAMQ